MWIGPKPAPLNMMETWQKMNPEREYKFRDENLIKEHYPNGLRNQKHYDEHETRNGKCDIARYEILYDFGGFFVDADAICINSLDDFFIESDSFSCFENEEIRGNLIACGYMGAIKGCELMRHCVEELQKTICLTEKSTGKMSWQTVGPLFFSETIVKYSYPIDIYPSYVFIPNHYTGRSYKGEGKSYADQKWGSTFGYENI